jgi:ABC-type thiamine transport system ATPase subunit
MQAPTLADCLSIAIDKVCEANDHIPIIGISGPQGAGKTTALNALYSKSTKRIATLGIDDFYQHISAHPERRPPEGRPPETAIFFVGPNLFGHCDLLTL